MPRIIAGKCRGLLLDAPPGRLTRPTSDRVKEALFSILAPDLAGASFLDLYAGSGQIGLEALSRGAAGAVFVETGHAALKVLQNNIEKSKLNPAAVLALPAVRALRHLIATGEKFDFIYADPPWERFERELALLNPYIYQLLKKGGRLITEREITAKTPETSLSVTGLEHIRHCRYGRAMLSFFSVKDDL